MAKTRLVLSDGSWARFLGVMRARGLRNRRNNRMVVEAVLWKFRTGAPWRDVPPALCPWQTAYNRFNRWSRLGLWKDFFFDLGKEVDAGPMFIDGTYVKAHQHSSGARRGEERAVGMSRGGTTSKIHAIVDALGRIVDFEITGGEVHDARVAPALIDRMPEGAVLVADRGYDSEGIRDRARERNMRPVIPRRRGDTRANPEFCPVLYKFRHLVENAFARLKHHRGVATRFEKLARNFKSAVCLVCAAVSLGARLA